MVIVRRQSTTTYSHQHSVGCQGVGVSVNGVGSGYETIFPIRKYGPAQAAIIQDQLAFVYNYSEQ